MARTRHAPAGPHRPAPRAGTDHYALVDEATVNSDADYVASGTVGDLDLYGLGDLPFTADAIHAVQVTVCA